MKPLFSEVLVAKAVYQEICSAGKGLVGARELEEAVETHHIAIKGVKNQLLLSALLDPLALGEAETIVLSIEEQADQLVLDDKAARRKAKAMKLNVIGTLRILRMMYDAKVISKSEIIKALASLRDAGFRISDQIINKVKNEI